VFLWKNNKQHFFSTLHCESERSIFRKKCISLFFILMQGSWLHYISPIIAWLGRHRPLDRFGTDRTCQSIVLSRVVWHCGRQPTPHLGRLTTFLEKVRSFMCTLHCGGCISLLLGQWLKLCFEIREATTQFYQIASRARLTKDHGNGNSKSGSVDKVSQKSNTSSTGKRKKWVMPSLLLETKVVCNTSKDNKEVWWGSSI